MAETAQAEQPPVALFKKRGGTAKNFRKRSATPPPATGSDDSEDDYASQDEGGVRVKRRKGAGVTAGSTASNRRPDVDELKPTQFAADSSSVIRPTNDATKQSNWFENDMSAEALLGKKNASQKVDAESGSADGTYKGAAGYQSFIQKSANAMERKVGPIKAPTNIRTITVTDYAPDVCKDYKQTGFCGFGDSCKFLHAREDYKQGWQLDKEWEVDGKGSKKTRSKTVASANRSSARAGGDDSEAEDKELEKIPFACVICKSSYKNPITTKCGHYFCQKCALDRYRKKPTCAICGQGTGGVFDRAKNFEKILERKRERARRRREKAREAGEDVSSGNDDNDDDDHNHQDTTTRSS